MSGAEKTEPTEPPCEKCNGRGFVFHHTLYSATRVKCRECGGTGVAKTGAPTPEELREHIAFVKAALNDQDCGRFYSSDQMEKMRAEVEAFERNSGSVG